MRVFCFTAALVFSTAELKAEDANAPAAHPLDTSNPNASYCEDFDDKCALVKEAAKWGIDTTMLCETEENGEKLRHYCPVTCMTCKVDCGWSEWSSWAPCSKTCGGGVQERTRVEVSPAQFGGADCETADATDARTCNVDDCPAPLISAEELRESLLTELQAEFQTIVSEKYDDEHSLDELTDLTLKNLKDNPLIKEHGLMFELKITDDATAGMLPEPKESDLGGSISIATEHQGKPTFKFFQEGIFTGNGQVPAAYWGMIEYSLEACQHIAAALVPVRVLTVEYMPNKRYTSCKIVPAISFDLGQEPAELTDFKLIPGDVKVEDLQEPYSTFNTYIPKFKFHTYTPEYPEPKQIVFNLSYWESE